MYSLPISIFSSASVYLIKSDFGYLRHFGEGFLEFSRNRPSDHFRFIKQNILQEVKTRKCLNRRARGFVDLTYNCNGSTADRWAYNSYWRRLMIEDNLKYCLSPWRYYGVPRDITVRPNMLSVCSGWNEITLELGRYYHE